MFALSRPGIINLARSGQILEHIKEPLGQYSVYNKLAVQKVYCSLHSPDLHAYYNIYGSLRRPKAKPKQTPTKDRRVPVSLELSIKYLNSKTYQNTYGDFKVWQLFRRNFRGPHEDVPKLTRSSCVGDDGFIKGQNPCPICRDKYLLIDYRNVDLLKQFVDPYTDTFLTLQRSNLCQEKYEELYTAYIKAKDYGILVFKLPQRNYNYDEYYHKDLLKQLDRSPDKIPDDDVLKKIALYPDFVQEDPAPYYLPNITVYTKNAT